MPQLQSLTLESPLELVAAGGVRMQLAVEAADGQGQRAFQVHSRAADAAEDVPWQRQASGVLEAQTESPADPAAEGLFPPPGAQALDVSDYMAG